MQEKLTEEEYFKVPGLNSTLLSAFAQSPDHALMEVEAKQAFSVGHAFEDVVWWKVYGDKSKFDERFFVADLGTPPDKIIQALESGEDLAALEVLTKAGERSKTYATLHAWIDACMEHPSRKPISKTEFDTLCTMADHLISMDLDGPAGDIIVACEWQVPIIWESQGIRKKALIDLVLHVGEELYIYDLKTTASLPMFYKMLREKYWIQDLHYCEGAWATWGKDLSQMTFLVAEKSAPYLAQPFRVSPDSRDLASRRYVELCSEFAEWDAAGRPARGWKPMEEVKVWT